MKADDLRLILVAVTIGLGIVLGAQLVETSENAHRRTALVALSGGFMLE